MPGKNVRNIIRRARHVPGPLAKAAMRIDSLHPLVQEPPFGAVLLRIAAFDLQDEGRTTVQPEKKIRPVFTDHTAIDIEHLKAEVIVLGPCLDGRVMVQSEGFRCLPGAVIDADIDVAPFARGTGLARVPGSHVSCGADGPVLVKDGLELLAVLAANRFPDVLYHLVHIQSDEEAALQVILGEQGRGHANFLQANELFDQANQLGEQVGFVALPGLLHLVVHIPRRLEDNPWLFRT